MTCLDKLDVVTFSWQKVLGGEAAHGVLICRPAPLARLKLHTALAVAENLPHAKAARSWKHFEGETINTPSMVAVEDYLDALNWAESIGGLKGPDPAFPTTIWHALEQWPANRLRFPGRDVAIRSNTSVCIASRSFLHRPFDDAKADAIKKCVSLLEKEGVALDIAASRRASRPAHSGAAHRR